MLSEGATHGEFGRLYASIGEKPKLLYALTPADKSMP